MAARWYAKRYRQARTKVIAKTPNAGFARFAFFAENALFCCFG